MADERVSLSPRETVKRMLDHSDDGISFEDIIRQVRVLQQIEWVMAEAESAGLPTGWPDQEKSIDIVRSARTTVTPADSSITPRNRPLYSWRSLAEQSDDHSSSVLGGATWVY